MAPSLLGRLRRAHLALAFIVLPVSLVRADAPPPIIANAARILPVLAEHGMVVTQEKRAAQVGVDILRAGGNAIDAAVAVGFALAVTLPRAGNVGGGGFMLVHLADRQEDVALDYRETAPAATDVSVFLDESGAAVPAKSRDSGLGIGVPGTVAGLAEALPALGIGPLHARGADCSGGSPSRATASRSRTTLPIRFRACAKRGSRGGPRAVASSSIRKAMLPLLHTIFSQPDLATTLTRIAEQGPRGFYEGETAERIVAAVRGAGGRMTADDMHSYTPLVRTPVRGTYRGHEIVSMPPPSSGGVHLIELLNILEHFPLAQYGAGSATAVHVMTEAMKRAFADRAEWMGDPAFVTMPVAALTAKTYAARLAAGITLDRATPAADISHVDPAPYEGDQTTHFSIVDAQGNAVANTYTLNFSYGLGLVADGTGVLLNNELDDFAARPGAPNAFGLVGGAANAPGPGKRPLSSMTPTFVLKDGKLEIVTGSPGGPRIITTVAEQIVDILDFGMNAAEAMESVRFHHQWMPDILRVERGLSPDTLALLRAKGHTVEIGDAMGSVATIHVGDGRLMGAADARQRGTAAVGY